MYKSTKRIKLENEIFSKSIKDIEQMFSFSTIETEERKHKMPSSQVPTSPETPSNYVSAQHNFPTMQSHPEQLPISHPGFNYDCINMSLFYSDKDSDEDSEYESVHEIMRAPILPSSSLLPWSPSNASEYSLSTDVLLDLNDEEEVDDYKFGSDLKSYLPRINLESDLKLIDQMFTGTLLTKA